MRARRCQREFESRGPVNTVALNAGQNELISGDQDGNIRVWDVTAGACSCELVPEVDVPVRSVSIALDGSQVRTSSNCQCYAAGPQLLLLLGTAFGK
jgi:target of rapamycin complex subunit LST8